MIEISYAFFIISPPPPFISKGTNMNCIKYAVKKIVIPLLVRYVQTESEQEKEIRYQKEFQKRLIAIREKNSKRYFERVVPEIRKEYIDRHGFLPPFDYVLTKAMLMFTKDIIDGKIDTLYQEKE